jgi:hypothetical protein
MSETATGTDLLVSDGDGFLGEPAEPPLDLPVPAPFYPRSVSAAR